MLNATSLSKQRLRRECRRIRANIDGDTRRQSSLAICRQIKAWQVFQNAITVLTYMAMRSEVDLSTLLKDIPQKRWAIPRIRAGGEMRFHTYDPGKLILHPYGMLEPDQDCPVIAPDEIQLVLVPGLAFDRDGWRLGYGGGFYDRFLMDFKGVSAGITTQQLLFTHVPHAGHDISMQYLITENGIRAISVRR
jgi:5-formyltetrahydrofolate cyclo-ligase